MIEDRQFDTFVAKAASTIENDGNGSAVAVFNGRGRLIKWDCSFAVLLDAEPEVGSELIAVMQVLLSYDRRFDQERLAAFRCDVFDGSKVNKPLRFLRMNLLYEANLRIVNDGNIILFLRDVTQQVRLTWAFDSLLKSSLSRYRNILDELCKSMVLLLGYDVGAIGVTFDEATRCRIVGNWSTDLDLRWKGKVYQLAGTPCGLVYRTENLHAISDELDKLFPSYDVANLVNAKAYVGRTFADGGANVIGHVFALSRQPMKPDAAAIRYIDIITQLVAQELSGVAANQKVAQLH